MAQPAPERIRIRNRFEEVCSEFPEWNELSAEKRETIIRRMERNCFEVTIESCIRDGIDRLFTEKKFVQRYSINCFRVMANLDVNSSIRSENLIKKLISGEVDPYKIAELPSRELCPEASQAERDEIELRQKQKFKGKVSRAYTCRKCKGNETIPIEFQGRGTDESSTYSIKCVNCEFVWRH